MLRIGFVLDKRSKPVAGAMVSVEWGTTPTTDLAYGTDRDGRFTVALPPGRFRLGAHGPDGSSASIETTVSEGDSRAADLVMVLGR